MGPARLGGGPILICCRSRRGLLVGSTIPHGTPSGIIPSTTQQGGKRYAPQSGHLAASTRRSNCRRRTSVADSDLQGAKEETPEKRTRQCGHAVTLSENGTCMLCCFGFKPKTCTRTRHFDFGTKSLHLNSDILNKIPMDF